MRRAPYILPLAPWLAWHVLWHTCRRLPAAKKLSGEKERRVYNCHFFHWQNEALENGRMRHSKHDIGVLQEHLSDLDSLYQTTHYRCTNQKSSSWSYGNATHALRPPSPTPHEISERISRPAVRKLISLLLLPLASRHTKLHQGNIWSTSLNKTQVLIVVAYIL